MRSEIIQIVACNNYDDKIINILASYFHENLFHYFKGYLITKLTLG
jgi:hypothetical protein